MSNFSALTGAWADNMHLDTLNAAQKLNSNVTSSMQATDTQRFWSTPARHGDDDNREVMEITLSNERLCNHITVDVVKFPHDAWIECFDLDVDDWVPLYQADVSGDVPCRKGVLDCTPPVLPPISAIEGHVHPQHSFSGHWESCEWYHRPRRYQRVRIVLKRHTRSRRPCNNFGKLIAYSLAVRNFYCGYKVYSVKCLPSPQPVLTSVTEHQEFATTTDVLGSAVNYSVRKNSAENVLLNDPASNDRGDETYIWRSEPQPNPYAVVNYFIDARDAAGDAQLIDRIYLDPTSEGPNINLYYSNDEPDANFKAEDQPLPPQLAVINGPITGPNPLCSDNQPYGRVTYVDIDNTPVAFCPGRRWWLGGRLTWKFQRGIDIAEHPIFDCGAFHVAWTRYGMRFATTLGDYFYVDCDDFQPATEFNWITWYDGNQAFIRLKVNGRHYRGAKTLTVPLSAALVAKLRIAGYQGSSPTASPDFKLHHMVLKCDQDVDDDLCDDFLENPEPYCVKSEFDHDDDGKTDNALLRYHPDFVTSDYPTGFRGGGPTRYSNMQWSPIARDYTLTKGFLYFSPTKAKYWKLEFCGLVPEPYEVYVPIKKTIKTYRTEMWSVPVYPAPTLMASISVTVPGCGAHIAVAAQYTYRDSLSIRLGSGVNISIGGKSNTMVRVITDHHAAQVVASVSWAWNFQPCHKPIFIPRFERTCVHEYDEIEIEQSTKIAYFAGLKYIAIYKVDYLSIDDTNQYIELFTDSRNIDKDSGWVLTDDHSLSSGETRFAQAQSRVMPSSRVVRAVQFAATQSAPVQLLPDDDFDDPNHLAWRSVGDGAMAPFTTTDQAVGSVLLIDRSSRNPSWDNLVAANPFWHSFSDQNFSFYQVEGSGNPGQAQGGIESAGVTVPPGGRVYAAARVVAPEALQSPLYVQLIDDSTGQVLSESASDVQANQITEWSTAYTIGDGGQVLAWRWRDFVTNPAYPTFIDNFARANAASLGTMTNNQVWTQGAPGHTIASNIAVTSTAGGYDYVDGLTPWGTYEVVVGTIGTGAAAALLYLAPVAVDDQGVLTYRQGKAAFATTSVFNRVVQANDDLRIDVLPTSLVPANLKDASAPSNNAAPYSLVFYLNGTWIKTIAHRMGARTIRGIFGRLNQQFKSFSWLPQNYGALPGPVLDKLPLNANGSFDAPRLTWTDIDGYVWAANGSWDTGTTVSTALVATANNSRMLVDTRYWYGCLSAWVRHVATGYSGAPAAHGFVLCLDAGNNIFLDYAGNVVKYTPAVTGTPASTQIMGGLVPGGITNNSFLQVQFLDTASTASSIRGSIDPAVYPRMLVARVAGNVVGTYVSASLQTWTGTRRGLAGDAYNPGLDVNGNPNALPGGSIADLHTSFETFGWAPDASTIAVDPKNPKWDDVSARGTGTYDSISHYLTLNQSKLRARVVQKNPSIDVWYMDTLSMFADPIVWSFSNDGGVNFYNAFDVRNNPHGVLVFPTGVLSSAGAGAPGTGLVWRVISYSPHARVASLAIRPWYGGLLSGITHRTGIANGGPNTMPYDHYPSIEQDARWQTWSQPVPQDWFYAFRVLSRTKDKVVPPPKVLLLPEAVTSKYKSEIGS